MAVQLQPRIEELNHEALWDSCINMVGHLPNWASGVETDFMEVGVLCDWSKSYPRSALTSLEFDILRSMGKPATELNKNSTVFVDAALNASRYPGLARSVASACLERATTVRLNWLPDDPEDNNGDLTKPYEPSARHPSDLDSTGDEAVWAGAWLRNSDWLKLS